MDMCNVNRFRNWFALGSGGLAGLSGPVYGRIRVCPACLGASAVPDRSGAFVKGPADVEAGVLHQQSPVQHVRRRR
jgi:hypothetical protein